MPCEEKHMKAPLDTAMNQWRAAKKARISREDRETKLLFGAIILLSSGVAGFALYLLWRCL